MVIVTMGAPGSGKSTWAKKYAADHNYFKVVSSDSVREQLYGDEAYQGNVDDVFNEFYRQANEWIAKGYDVILDATHTTSWACKQSIIRTHDKQYLLMMFRPSLDECIYRNNHRSRVVPEKVIRRMYKQLDKLDFCNINEVAEKMGKQILASTIIC